METPPNYSQYPRAGQTGGVGGSGRGYRGPGIYFDFISEAFNIVKNNLGVYAVGALLALIIFYAVQIPFSFMTNMIAYGSPTGSPKIDSNGLPKMNFMVFPISIVIGIIPGAVLQAMCVGMSLCALEEADTGKTSINTMFSGFRNFLPLLGTVVLTQIATTIGMIFCIFPFFLVAGVLSFAPLFTVHEGLGPIEAITKSFNLLKPYIWPMGGFFFVTSLVSGLGICACGIGIFFTLPILYICIALHYREFRGPLNQGFVAPQVP
jgi:hypothetical protein